MVEGKKEKKKVYYFRGGSNGNGLLGIKKDLK
jgi:hypothetical protein